MDKDYIFHTKDDLTTYSKCQSSNLNLSITNGSITNLINKTARTIKVKINQNDKPIPANDYLHAIIHLPFTYEGSVSSYLFFFYFGFF